MKISSQIASRVLLPLAIAALPVVLLLSSIRTFREVDEQRTIYLRHRVAVLAARLENLPASTTADSLREKLGAEERHLIDVEVIAQGAPADVPNLASIWNGRELFRIETPSNGKVFRALVPFHSDDGLRIARIDLNSAAADFLLVHARHNVIAASLGGLVLVLLSFYSIWAVRRASRLQMKQLEMEHLAHIGKMSAMLAHEIRNPLGTIKGFVQLVGERADPATRDLLAPALTETERLELLVNDLLAYGRPPRPNHEIVSWDVIASQVQAHARQIIGGRPIRLVVPDAEFEWRTDPALLGQALLNLVRNAIEAVGSAGDGEVRIEGAPTERGDVIISVKDNGAGLSDQAQARLFEPFFTTKAFGTGLGLAITRKLIHALDGDLELRRGNQRGTEATIKLRGPAVANVAAG